MTIPSSKKDVVFRPFLVKEEKALMIAQQSENPDEMLETLKSVISECLIDNVNVDNLALFDVEYIFAQLRAKSVGETVDLIFRCDKCTDKKASVQYTLDLTKLEVTFFEGHEKKIALFNDVGVIMRYPSFNALKRMETMKADDVNGMFDIVCMCIESVYDSQQVYSTADQTPEEVREFVDNLTQDQFKKIQNFFDTMPILQQKVEYACPVCGLMHKKYIRGLDSFF